MRRNVLITSAGRRGKLAAIFRHELALLIPDARVFAADLRPEASAACQIADDSFAVPAVNNPHYAERLIELCMLHDIGLVVPTIDPELPVLADRRDEFAAAGIAVAVSDSAFVSICRDKRRTERWFNQRGVSTPQTISPHTATEFPIFAKPFDGSCSQGTYIIRSAADLTPGLVSDPRTMFVEYVSPEEHDEYTLDMYYDCDSRLRCCVPRLRIETRGGEVSKSRTCRAPAIGRILSALAYVAGARGCITLQVFVHRESLRLLGIEINPRFGGGYPLSYDAGANYPRWLIQEHLLEQKIESFDDWEDNLTMLRYDDHVLVRGAA
jgi:carbamoyl-phosphate synthase large subunit